MVILKAVNCGAVELYCVIRGQYYVIKRAFYFFLRNIVSHISQVFTSLINFTSFA